MKIDAYIVGGFVRDLLLQRNCKDIDVVCVGSGIDLALAAAAKISPQLKVQYFKNFGTAHFNYKGVDYEFVGARKESYNRDSRKPVVENGTLEEDQLRRDFTINALAISLNKANWGHLVDPFNGLDDLKNELLRTPQNPDITFSDDPLRMMRAARFATQLHFSIHADALQAMQKNAERINIVSKERIIDELNKIILAPQPSIGFRILYNTGILFYVFPELCALQGVHTQEGLAHKDNFFHTLQVLDNLSETSDNLWLRWSAIMHDLGKERTKKFEQGQGWTFHGHEIVGAKMVPKIFAKLKLPLDTKMKYVQKLVYLHMRPIALTNENVTDSAIRRLLFDAGDDIDDLMLLCRADISSKNKAKVQRFLQNYNMVQEKLVEVEAKDRLRNWQPPVSGEEIMTYFNLSPSREVGIIKNAIREAILDGEIENSYEAAYNFMLKKAATMGIYPKNNV
ncbi:MAG: HD domain-containing protein [Bacteroidetes bacterium]|nr:HD domain-containing protein [Bacteroidota bacterium]MCB9043005.1 HD domain-containing protein [Chitinophagales bacterium]